MYRQQQKIGGEFKIGCVLLCFESLIHLRCPAYQGRLALVSLPQGAAVNKIKSATLTLPSAWGGPFVCLRLLNELSSQICIILSNCLPGQIWIYYSQFPCDIFWHHCWTGETFISVCLEDVSPLWCQPHCHHESVYETAGIITSNMLFKMNGRLMAHGIKSEGYQDLSAIQMAVCWRHAIN